MSGRAAWAGYAGVGAERGRVAEETADVVGIVVHAFGDDHAAERRHGCESNAGATGRAASPRQPRWMLKPTTPFITACGTTKTGVARSSAASVGVSRPPPVSVSSSEWTGGAAAHQPVDHQAALRHEEAARLQRVGADDVAVGLEPRVVETGRDDVRGSHGQRAISGRWRTRPYSGPMPRRGSP
jgi:hypothetical protein